MFTKNPPFDDVDSIKPEADGMRYLRGKKAKVYEKYIESHNTKPFVDPLSYLVLEARRRLLEYVGIECKYFDNRHLFSLTDRRLLDIYFVHELTQVKESDADFIVRKSDAIWHKYLSLVYRRELNRKYKWGRMTSRSEEHTVFVCNEDYDKYVLNKNG
jgi:hypothetical protein